MCILLHKDQNLPDSEPGEGMKREMLAQGELSHRQGRQYVGDGNSCSEDILSLGQ